MTKLIIQITKTIIAIVTTLLFTSCNQINWPEKGIEGNGKIVKVKRTLDQSFDKIFISRGIELIIEQADENKMRIETDENIQDHIITEIIDNNLKIYTDTSLYSNTHVKIYLNFQDLKEIHASSNSYVLNNKAFKIENLKLKTSSNASLKIKVIAKDLKTEASSGSQILLEGSTNNISAEASSGSHINAEELSSINASAKASSGGEINFNTVDTLKAKASSGGDITYLSTPSKIEKKTSSGGTIKLK